MKTKARRKKLIVVASVLRWGWGWGGWEGGGGGRGGNDVSSNPRKGPNIQEQPGELCQPRSLSLCRVWSSLAAWALSSGTFHTCRSHQFRSSFTPEVLNNCFRRWMLIRNCDFYFPKKRNQFISGVQPASSHAWKGSIVTRTNEEEVKTSVSFSEQPNATTTPRTLTNSE